MVRKRRVSHLGRLYTPDKPKEELATEFRTYKLFEPTVDTVSRVCAYLDRQIRERTSLESSDYSLLPKQGHEKVSISGAVRCMRHKATHQQLSPITSL